MLCVDKLIVVVYNSDNMENYTSLLTQLGLSDKESALYLALLELGQADVADTAKKAGVKRSTAYVLLESRWGK
jgi:sugar-specific transcriptional regulator TrmB